MRLDKYLQVSRLIKRRTIAKQMADAGRVFVNNKKSKPSEEIKLNDYISIKFGHKTLNIKVIEVKEYASINEAANMYELVNGTNDD